MNGLITVGVRILEVLFFAGWIGSILVIVLSGVDDVEVILSKKEDSQSQPKETVVTQEPREPS